MHLCISCIYIHIYIPNRETSFIAVNGIQCFYTHYLNKNFRHLKMESLVSYCGILLPSCGHICVLQQNLIPPPHPLTNPQYRHLTGSQKEENFFFASKQMQGKGHEARSVPFQLTRAGSRRKQHLSHLGFFSNRDTWLNKVHFKKSDGPGAEGTKQITFRGTHSQPDRFLLFAAEFTCAFQFYHLLSKYSNFPKIWGHRKKITEVITT